MNSVERNLFVVTSSPYQTPEMLASLGVWMKASEPWEAPEGSWAASALTHGKNPVRIPWLQTKDVDGVAWGWRVTQVRPQGVCGYVAHLSELGHVSTVESAGVQYAVFPRGLRNWRITPAGTLVRPVPWQRALLGV